jgi:hypothetical protein
MGDGVRREGDRWGSSGGIQMVEKVGEDVDGFRYVAFAVLWLRAWQLA